MPPTTTNPQVSPRPQDGPHLALHLAAATIASILAPDVLQGQANLQPAEPNHGQLRLPTVAGTRLARRAAPPPSGPKP